MQMQAGTRQLQNGDVMIVIPLEPRTKKNSLQIRKKKYIDDNLVAKERRFISQSDQYKNYEKDCAIFLRHLDISDPVNVEAKFYMRTRRRVDLTNLNEALHDILVAGGILTDDNCRIIVSTDGSCVYFDKDNPRTEVLITRREGTGF